MKKVSFTRVVKRFGLPLLFLLAIFGHTAFKKSNHSFEITKGLDIYSAILKEIDLYYVDSIDPEKMTGDALNGMLTKLDPYTSYYTEKEKEAFEVATTGEYAGIGAVIQQRDSFVIIADPYEGRPAQIAGLKAGDVLLQIDSIQLKGMTTEQVSNRLKGKPNTKMVVTIERASEDTILMKEITRKKIAMDPVPYYGMVGDSIGYIYLSSFTEKAANNVREALIDLRDNYGAKSLVLDLRGNPGGLMEDAIEIVNLFVPKGEVVLSTRGKVKQWDRIYKTTKTPIAPDMPLAVMVDHGSASASEIVAGALQDLDRAIIVGNQSFGKGLVQTTRSLPYNTMLKVTTAKYYIPSGRSVQAIDYSHRNADGSVARIPDSLTTAYKTANGRIVKDGGGVKPEIEVEEERTANIVLYLMRDMHIFDFATKYAAQNPTIPPVEEFVVTDEIYNDFKDYVKGQEFTYDKQSEKALKTLQEIAEFEGYMESAKGEFEALEQKLSHNLEKDLDTFRPQIAQILASEIAKRYYYQKGEIKQSLKEDKGLEMAIEKLSNPTEYKALLTPLSNSL